MEKTIKEWLETLPEPYKSEALENATESTLFETLPSLTAALYASSYWTGTPQGHNYWLEIAGRAEAGEFNNSSLDKDSEK